MGWGKRPRERMARWLLWLPPPERPAHGCPHFFFRARATARCFAAPWSLRAPSALFVAPCASFFLPAFVSVFLLVVKNKRYFLILFFLSLLGFSTCCCVRFDRRRGPCRRLCTLGANWPRLKGHQGCDTLLFFSSFFFHCWFPCFGQRLAATTTTTRGANRRTPKKRRLCGCCLHGRNREDHQGRIFKKKKRKKISDGKGRARKATEASKKNRQKTPTVLPVVVLVASWTGPWTNLS